jgi:4-amino-4-deoxy-L-arabinose transferase-like glycosyltransferase
LGIPVRASEKQIRIWLAEYDVIMRRIEQIDARIWQGAGIFLVLSLGGLSFVIATNVQSLERLLSAISVGFLSIVVALTWIGIYNRWLNLQRVYSDRARELEDLLDVWFNRYAYFVEYWTDSKIEQHKAKLEAEKPVAYKRICEIVKERRKHWWDRIPIRLLIVGFSCVIIVIWIAIIAFKGLEFRGF